VGPRTTAIVRLEGALHVRAPEVDGGSLSQGPTTAQARGQACISEPSSDRSTVRGSVGQGQTGRTNRRRIQPAGSEPATLAFQPPTAGRRHAENTGESCGQRLMPRVEVVSVAGSTRATTTRPRQRMVPCFRRSGLSRPGRARVGQTLHTLWTMVWTCRAAPYDRHRSVIAGSELEQRETA
jgi:hypothetical protein